MPFELTINGRTRKFETGKEMQEWMEMVRAPKPRPNNKHRPNNNDKTPNNKDKGQKS